jgi:hypothetical protein
MKKAGSLLRPFQNTIENKHPNNAITISKSGSLASHQYWGQGGAGLCLSQTTKFPFTFNGFVSHKMRFTPFGDWQMIAGNGNVRR